MAANRYLLLAIVLAVFLAVGAFPAQDQPDFQQLAKEFQENARKQFEDFQKQGFQSTPFDVKNLPNDDNTHVHGESVSTYQKSSNVDGVQTEEHGGHKVINDDGKIQEYDLA